MKTKAKKFSHKLLALIMAVVMAATCFTGVMTSYAASSDIEYNDSDTVYNDLAWNVLSDEQAATALLDLADYYLPYLKDMEPELAKMVSSLDLGGTISLDWDASARELYLKLGSIKMITISVKLGSVNELIETVNSANGVLGGSLVGVMDTFNVDLGFLYDLDLSALKNDDGTNMTREVTTSCDIVRGVLGLIYDNNAAVIGKLLKGTLSTGVIGIDIYKELSSIVGGVDKVPNGSAGTYTDNFVYNFLMAVLFKYTEWFDQSEKDAYIADPTTFEYDAVLLDKMSTHLLDLINAEITYADGTSSKTRRAEIEKAMAAANMSTDPTSAGFWDNFNSKATELYPGYDTNLKYSEENPGNILLFTYGSESLKLEKTDSLFTFAYKALKLAWNTALKDTIKLVHVNNSVERGHGSNFDNVYYYWLRDTAKSGYTWDYDTPANNYTADKIQAWFDAAYADYGATDAAEFEEWVKDNYRFSRTVADDANNNWSDINATSLFNKLRYSPLADMGFNMQTGPINLYFSQLGTPALDEFFETEYAQYDSLVGGLNDCLLAAVKDIFVDSDNVYYETKGDTTLYDATTGKLNLINVDLTGTIDSAAIGQITDALVANALDVVEYVANTTDQNILNPFYNTPKPDGSGLYGKGAALSEDNLETAMIPLLIACIGQVNLTGHKLCDMIHPEDWDRCKDAEAVAFLCLREYLSYVLPNKNYNTLATFTDTEITADFDACILPMARDAIIYVIEPYVPVTDKNGNKWSAAGDTIDTTTSIFDLFNSVLCYYADDFDYSKGYAAASSSAAAVRKANGERALGVASLIGLCDNDGNSTITMEGNRTLWDNLNDIINHLLPVVGTLQGTGYGAVDSESLIMDDIVNGVLNIADTHTGTGRQGVSNFIYRLLTIISAEPIQTTAVHLTVYDVVQELLSALFDPRYNPGEDQKWYPVPKRSSDHPWDDVLQHDVLAGAGDSDAGLLVMAVNNFVEFSGFGYNGVATYKDSIVRGLMFAVSAVNSFVNIIPNMGDSEIDTATVSITNNAVTGCSANAVVTSPVRFSNSAMGINVAYVDGINETVKQLNRYFMKITGYSVTGGSTSSKLTTDPTGTVVAPMETVDLELNTYYVENDEKSTSYALTINYDVYADKACTELLYTGLSATGYQFLSAQTDWVTSVFPTDRRYQDANANQYWFASDIETEAGSSSDCGKTVSNSDGYSFTTSAKFRDYLKAQVVDQVVLDNQNLSDVDHFVVRIANTAGSISSRRRSIDGVYYYDEKSVYDDASNGNVTVGYANPKAVFNKETGDLIRYGLYDVSTDSGTSWTYTSKTQAEVDTILQDMTAEAKATVKVRDHVAVTFADALSTGLVAAYHIDPVTNEYQYIYLKNESSNSNYKFDVLLDNISTMGPVEGFYSNTGKQTIEINKSAYFNMMSYDGETAISNINGETAHICFYNSTQSCTMTYKLYVCDTTSGNSIDDTYDELLNFISKYTAADFTYGDTVINAVKEALLAALSAKALPLTPDTAAVLADTTELTFDTATSTSTYGDLAYTPLTIDDYNALDSAIKSKIYVDNSDGTYKFYLDAAHSRPVYSTVPLTAAGVTADGKDAYGIPVTLVTAKDGSSAYYIANSVQYATEWDTTSSLYTTYPCKISTGVQAVDNDGNALYDQIQWAYYNKDGNRVTSDSTWVVKMPDTSYQLVECTTTTDNRGMYSKAIDRMNYVLEYVKANVDQTAAQQLLKDVSLARRGLNQNNFEIVTFNKMVDMAKTIESKYSVNVKFTRVEYQYDANGEKVLGADGQHVGAVVSYDQNMSYSSYDSLLNDAEKTIKAADYSSDSNLTDGQPYVVIDASSVNVQSDLSSTQITEYLRIFNIFFSNVVQKGYLGDRLVEEIPCASGNTYDKLYLDTADITAATNADNGGIDFSQVPVQSTSTSATPIFGAFDANGQLVNDGPIIYPTNLWNTYTEALARATYLATIGESRTYAYCDESTYDKTANYEARPTAVYDAKIDLQAAEVALEKTKVLTVNADGGSIVLTADGVDTTYTKPTAFVKGTDVAITATAADTNTFTGYQIGDDTTNIVTDNPYTVSMGRNATVTALFDAATSAGYNVSGNIYLAKNGTGGTDNVVPYGDFHIDLYDTADMSGNVIASTDIDTKSGDNSFTIQGLADGTYYARVTSDYMITLTNVVIKVNGHDVEGGQLLVVACDFDGSGTITSADAQTVFTAAASGTKKEYCDLDGSGSVATSDAQIVFAFTTGSNLPTQTIE